MPDYEHDVVPPLRRPTLLLAILGSAVSIAIGFSEGSERAILVPAVVALLWAAAYRAQPSESVRRDERRRPGAVVVRRADPIPPRPRKQMPPTPSRLSPAAAVAASDEKERKGRPGKPLYVPVRVGLPDIPAGEKKPKSKQRTRGKRRGKGGGGDPTLGL